MTQGSPREHEDQALQQRRVRQFLGLMLPVAVGFCLVYLATAALLHSAAIFGAALVVLAYAVVVALALRAARKGAWVGPALAAGSGLLGMTATGGVLIPFLMPALLIIPITAVALVLPFIRGPALRRFLLATVAVEAVTAVAGVLPPLLRQPGGRFEPVIIVAAAIIAAGLALLLLWQDATRLRRSVEIATDNERKATELAERYRVLIETTASVVWIAAPDGTIHVDSPSWRAFTGQSTDQFLKPGGWLEAIHPDDRARAAESWQRATAEGALYEIEYRLRRGDGTYATTVARGAPVRDAHGAIREWSGVNVDVTAARALTEAEARSNARALRVEQQFRSLFDAPLVGFLFVDTEGKIVDANDAFLRLVGYSREELERGAVTWETLTPPEHLDVSHRALEQLRRGEAAPHFEKEYVRRDGSRVPVLLGSVPIQGQRQSLTYVLDLTARRRAESALHLLARAGELLTSFESSTTLTTVVELAVSAVADLCFFDIALEGGGFERVAVASRDPALHGALERLKRRYAPLAKPPFGVGVALQGVQKPEVIELSDAQLVLVARDPAHLEGMRALGMRRSVSVPLRARDRVLGALTFAQTSDRPLTADDVALAEELGRRAAVALVNAQLYEAAQADRTRAEEANRLKDEFLATVSHELRTPLTSILGWVQMLRSGSVQPDRVPKALETIDRNARAQARLIEELLDVSRIISGKMVIERVPVALEEVSQAALDSARPAAQAKGIVLTSRISPAVGTLLGDPARLQQVIWNLVTNAVKFTQRGGHVELAVAPVGESVEVVVRDDGPGMAASFLPHVFERFRQADAGSSRSHGGLGLGLSIVRQLVELHGGTVSAESPGLGQGSTFTVTLPLTSRPRPATGEPARREAERPSALLNKRVLVVDDEPDMRDLVVAQLGGCGMQVEQAGSAAEALSRIAVLPPDLLVADLGMPGEDGFALIRKLRALAPEHGGTVPALALTAYARAEDRARALGDGFDAHLAKPVVPDELIRVLTTILSERRPR